MSTPQTTLLLAIYDLEDARTLRCRPSGLLYYFCNESINQSILAGCLDAIAQKVRDKTCYGDKANGLQISSAFLKHMSRQVVVHSLPPNVPEEVCKILVGCTHRFRKVREIALSYARQILETFSGLMCDRQVVFTLLEILTLMRRSCEMQYTDEVRPLTRRWLMYDSIRRCTNSHQTRWTSRSSSRMIMRCGTRSPHNYTV